MGTVFLTLLFVIAVSVDSFGIGCMIGLKKIGLSFTGICGIAMLSGLCYLCSATAGHLLLPYINPNLFEWLAALSFIGLGVFFIWSNHSNHEDSKEDSIWTQPARVLKSPENADIDDSGGIQGKEVILLGLALSLDTIGAGFSSVFIGIKPLYTAGLIAMMTYIMLYGGLKSGERFRSRINHLSNLPGILLIIIGLIKLV
ncbi:manganese efflux pump [Halobacillus sp. A5]|uniref:manganese efflux pump n=1 Tax=Halobacillus sp. A5 TaxID=2880263 RepID=UPI0020A6A018|nr:manganese efflux pump [Halobacillus sp. A5]MCP3025468.1 manganese efflux pump [Halobacillus sp. A5]